MTLLERDLRRMHLLHQRELHARLHRSARAELRTAQEVLLRGGHPGRPDGAAHRRTAPRLAR
ncbi:hypothetical protein GXP71_02480 [Cellulomonas sp. H30R-01]|jgi:hypothetical protein|uniref:hypothetical protein n=1 Tax=Cellulomonas sp. H30R-01 TaxID=2704467 RepID=UPI00138CAD29|nr:hypothetical protein [Cellulomonas sp. H30R-01]QHT55064.1 hypothetical protein GXP71_02480 [Cellulomonas sp. H30R-01]